MSLSPATRAEYARDVAAFLTWLRGRALTPETLIHYRDELQGSGRGASSVNRALAAVRSSLKALARETLNGKQAAVVGTVLAGVHGVKKVSSPVTEARMLTPEEREKILACSSSRLGCILKFLYATGARVSEAVGVRLSDCTEVGEIVLVRLTGKGNKEREVRVGRELLEEIRAVYDGETYLFETSGGKPLRREYVTHCLHRVALRSIGRPSFAHALRHSFASETIRRTGKVEGTSRYLGHADPATTLRYYVHESLTNADLELG
jgi:integrase/recombinase XerD